MMTDGPGRCLGIWSIRGIPTRSDCGPTLVDYLRLMIVFVPHGDNNNRSNNNSIALSTFGVFADPSFYWLFIGSR